MQICETCVFIATTINDERRIAGDLAARYSKDHERASKASSDLAWANYRETERFKIAHDRYFHGVELEVNP